MTTEYDPMLDDGRDRGEAPVGSDDRLLPPREAARFMRLWEDLQAGFVDEPRGTVGQADELVAQVMSRIAEGFANERDRLEGQWARGEDVPTEDLRVALQRYREFFRRCCHPDS
jgi:hypothetical protein